VLIDALRDISTGGGHSGGTTIQIGDIYVTGNGGDGASLARQIKEALLRELDDFTFKSKVEQIVHRANRAYIA
jgi:hypothetical protein